MTYPDKYYCKVGQREGEGCFSHKKADVPCYISRPTEKKIVMWYMITVSLCSIALGEDFERLNMFSAEFKLNFRRVKNPTKS